MKMLENHYKTCSIADVHPFENIVYSCWDTKL